MNKLHSSGDQRKIVAGGTQMLASQVVVILFSVLSQRFILSGLTKEENGELFLVRRMIEVLTILFVDFGFNPGALRSVARDSETRREILSSLAAWRVASWLIVVLIVSGMSLYSHVDATAVVLWCCYLLLASRSSLLRYLFEIPYRARLSFQLPLLATIADSLLLTIGVYIFRNQLSVPIVMAVFAVSVVPGMLIMISGGALRDFRLRFVRWHVLKQQVAAAVPVLATVALLMIHDRLDAFLLSWVASPAEVGVFGAAYQSLAPFTTTLPIAAGSVLLPVVSRLSISDKVRCARYVSLTLRLLFSIGLIIASVGTIVVPEIIDVMTSGKYADNALTFAVLMWSVVPIFVTTYLMETLNAYGAQKRNVLIVTVLALSTVALGLVLIPLYASVGASITKVVSVAIAAALSVYVYSTVGFVKPSLSFIVRLTTAIVVCVLLALFIPTIMNRLSAVGTVLLLSSFSVFALRIVKIADLRRIVSQVRSAS